MAVSVTVDGGSGGALVARAQIAMTFTEYGSWVKDQAIDKLMLICEAVKVQTQKNVSKGSSSYGHSLPGEYPNAITGRLRNSIFWDIDKVKMIGRIGTPLMYGLWLEVGTEGGQLIVPVTAKVLSWIDSQTGERRFARSVIRGGIQPRSYLRRTLVESADLIKKIMNKPMPKPPSGAIVIG